MPPLARARVRLRLRALDARDRLSGRADRLVPPRGLGVAPHSEHVALGEELTGYLVAHAGLTASSRVLDVGCGAGRIARPLRGILGSGGSYDGLDRDPAAVGWCRRRYRRDPRFRFVVADVADERSDGGHRGADYRFPYADGRFDVVVMADVLTHLLPEECERHVAEAARILAPGGTLLATLFALNDTSRALMAAGTAGLVFADAQEPVALLDEELPDEAVAYADEWIFERLREHGLTLTGLHPGSWCGREEFMSFQDVLVAVRDA